jgi:hypothetical protein
VRDHAGRIADAVTEAVMKAGVSQSVAVETILRQLVTAGRPIEDIRYIHDPGAEDSVDCQGVRVMLITHRYTGTAITIRYQLYPDGRPDGWPELDFQEGVRP